MYAQLVERNGAQPGRIYALADAVTTIGRQAGNDIVLPSQGVSRRHAELRWEGDHYVLRDLGSHNGTRVNGCRVTTPQTLHHDDVLILGDITLIFHEDKTVTVSPSETAPGTDVPLRVDLATAQVWVAERRVRLTAQEYRAMLLLYGRQGTLVTKEELVGQVWPEYGDTVADESLQQLVSRLRRKLEPDPEQPRYLLTVRGLGYRLLLQ